VPNKLAIAGVAASVVVGASAGILLFGPGGAAAKNAPPAPKPVDVVVTTTVAPTTVPPAVALPSTTLPPATIAPVITTTVVPKVATPGAVSSPSTAATAAPSVTAPAATVADDASTALVFAALQSAGIDGAPNGAKLGDRASDLSIAAGVIQISEADLVAALKSGQSLAQVASSKNVDPQKVIDALVDDAKSEIAAALAANKITQAQADQLNANVVQRITNRVNTVPMPPPGAHH